jgi:hypothetical protein
MKDLIGIHPTGIVRSFGVASFYYGIQPNAVQNLRANDEFTVVYSPKGKDVWRSVRFSVIGDQKDYSILEMRILEPAEIAYLEGKLNPTKQPRLDYATAS